MQRMHLSNQLIQRRTGRAGRICLLVLLFVCCSNLANAELVYSKSRRFRIPFQSDAAELKKLNAKEVQLFVSRDGGEHWKLADGVSPEVGKFTFEAPEDGVYWFSVKSLAASGLMYPPGPHQSGLNVLIDSTPPQLELRLEEIEPGRVRLSWQAHDEHLDLSTLKLEFREAGSGNWTLVAVRNQDQGQTSWTTSQGGNIQVRGEVADLSGNQSQAETTCEQVAPRPRKDQVDYSKPVASEPRVDSTVSANSPTRPPEVSPRLTSSQTGQPVPVKETVVISPSGPAVDSTQNSSPANASRPVHHKVNSATFRVGYDLSEVGPSGVKTVDIYITEDQGQKWFHYGQDPDRTSPMEVTVPRDGEYGLAFRVTNGLGRVEIPPQPGTPPEVQITVDRTAPVARLMPLQQGAERDSNQLMITWNAQDPDLSDRPVALFYAIAQNGPWEAIQGWQANSGRFDWTIPATVDQPIYIRLDVKDNSGNLTRVYAEKPFVIDRSQPRARVTGVEPLNNSPSR